MVATMGWGEEAERRLNEIANCSAGGEGVTRFPFTQQHMAANEIIRSWMSKAGLTTRVDAAGTLIGRKEGSAGHKTFLIGSHQDSVRNGGRYDGTMGIVVACLAMEKLARDRTMLPFSVELLAFADEEGVRFPTALLGPRALAGTVDQAVLRMADQDGITLADALHKFGGDPSEVVNLKRESGETLGYLEVHIEQGPVLEREKTPIGIVTGICGIERNFVTFTGETGHAGTVPMTGRRDALVAAAEFITAVENAARRAEDLRATVGSLVLKPDVANAIPCLCKLTLEIRSPRDGDRSCFADWARETGHTISTRRGVDFAMERTYVQSAVPCSDWLVDIVSRAAGAIGHRAPHMPSGATHDASAMADLCPISMIFVRCRHGVSHRPDEHASSVDMNVAVETTAHFLATLAQETRAVCGRPVRCKGDLNNS